MKNATYLVLVFFAALAMLISCTDYQQGPAGPVGPQGPAGPVGPQGPAGTSCTATQIAGGVQVACTDGTSATVLNGAPGTAGAQGAPGTSGAAGANGHSALLNNYPNDINCGTAGGSLQTSEVTVSADLCNGAVGAAGATGPAGASPEYSPIIVINPCGPNSSSYKEALLGLSGGGVFGEFTENTSALTVRNTLIPDGGYYDTDDSQCYFNVSTSSGNRSVTWNGSTANGSGPWGAGSASYTASNSQWSETYSSPGN